VGERQWRGDEVAIIGMAGKFPGAHNLSEYWHNLTQGVESITVFSDEELLKEGFLTPEDLRNPNFVKASPVLEDMEWFDAPFFGFTPREADIRDPQQRVFLECAYEALQFAGYDPRRYEGAIGVFGGTYTNRYSWLFVRKNRAVLRSVGSLAVEIANHADYVATLVAYKLNLRGPAMTVATACSTSMVAVHLACQALRNGECDMALAGAVEIELPMRHGYMYAEGGIFSPDGHCRAFDASAQGTIFGSGVGVLLVKRLDDALADGDPIQSVILGSAVNNDGSQKVGFTAPSVQGQRLLIAETYGAAGIDPTTVSYVEAHGTGTALGDPIEIAALTETFLAGTERRRWCAIGSVKTNIGHLGPAAGAAGLIKTTLALQNEVIPPHLHFESPNPKIDFDNSPFFVNTELREWNRDTEPRRAGVSAFGIGGTNCHVILEEAPAPGPTAPSRPQQLLLLSARTETALAESTSRLAAHLEAAPHQALADLAYTLQVGREQMRHRRALVAADLEGALGLLNQPSATQVTTAQAEARPRPVAFMFPGQGAQQPGMAGEIYQHEPAYRRAVDRCAELLAARLGFDLREVLYPRSDAMDAATERLLQTAVTQPALFTVEYALAQLWMEWGIQPAAFIGHSIGEYVAACLAGVFSLEDALALVAERGALMQSMPRGSMVAVPLPEPDVLSLAGGRLDLAAVNGPGLCVLSGPDEIVKSLVEELKAKGVEASVLRTSHAFHSRMMDPILEVFADTVRKAEPKPPTIPFVSNPSGTWIAPEQATDPLYWARHLRETVRFSEGLAALLAGDGHVLLEVGPGQTLSGLARLQPEAAGRLIISSLRHPQRQDSDLGVMLAALGKLWAVGHAVDWSGFYAHERRRRVVLPTYPFERRKHWVDPDPDAETRPARPGRAAAPGGERIAMEDWFSVPVWSESPPLSVPPASPDAVLERSPWLIFADTEALGELIAARLRHLGGKCVLVDQGRFAGIRRHHCSVDPRRRDDYVALFDELKARALLPRTVVHMWTTAAQDATRPSAERVDEDLDLGFHSLSLLTQVLARHPAKDVLRVKVVASGMQDVLGKEPLSPARAAALGVVMVLPKEGINTVSHAIDVALPQSPREKATLVGQLVAELASDADAPLVALRGHRRWVRRLEPVSLGASADRMTALRKRGVYLITGGLGAVGLTLAEQLAEAAKARVVLLGRSGFLHRKSWDQWLANHGPDDKVSWQIQKLRAIENAGGKVLILRADSSDRGQMEAALARINKRFGQVNGVIHAAGISGGGMLAVKPKEAAQRVLVPKVHGGQVIADLLGGKGLDLAIYCSSLISVTGDFGLGDYCAANNVLDVFAQQMHASGVHSLSVNFPAWLDIGMAVQAMATDVPAAFREMQRGAASQPTDHPLLDRRIADRSGDFLFSTVFTPTSTWVLDEHRINGEAVVPGVGYLELARAAFAESRGSGPVELRDVVFLAPLRVESNREVRTVIKPGDDRDTFTVIAGDEPAGRDGSPWTEYARGSLRRLEPSPLPRHDLDAIRSRCQLGTVAGANLLSRTGIVVVGAHWDAVKTVHVGEREELAEIELPDAFVDEINAFGLHPAILDCATSFAQTLIPAAPYLPFGYACITVRAPLPRRVWSHIKVRPGSEDGAFVTRDIVILDESGAELVRIDAFTLRKIDPSALQADGQGLPAAASAQPAPKGGSDRDGFMERRASDELAYAIKPAEAVECLRRILAAPVGPQVVICAEGLERKLERTQTITQARIMEELAGASLATPTLTERNVSTAYAEPGTDLEKALAALWQEALGVSQVGVDDDFFDLGGNSLVAVQLASRVRERYRIELPLPTLFESPTVRRLAANVEAALLEKVASMTDEEAAAMLAQTKA